jgi:23S rRNA (uracil1939-C5)-methyltransferase
VNEDDGSEIWIVERLVPGGDGFSRLADGRVGFARGAFPGDRIRPLRKQDRKSYVRALEWQLVEPSAQRVAAKCSVARQCGGCDLMELELPAQRVAKAGMLREALARTGGLRLAAAPPILSSGPEFGYRNRLRLHIDERGRLGLFARGSHTLVEIPECVVCEAPVNRALLALRELDPAKLARFSEVEIRCIEPEARSALCFVARAPQREPRPTFLAELSAEFEISVMVSDSATDRSEAPIFSQVNRAINQALIERLLELVQSYRIRTFVEVYAGAGNFTLPLLWAGLTGVAIEGNRRAAKVLEDAARASGLVLRVLMGDALQCFRRLPEPNPPADLVLLDPPRAGARELMAEIAEREPAHIAVCACDPVTLARDLRRLTESGYDLAVIEGFDMFPQTHHVEALAWMTKKP